jgi:hypothetical protein
MQKIISKVLFNYIALIATANNEFIDAMVGIHFHNVPENGHSTN